MMHELVLKEIVSFLHETFPDASVGVSGSIATGMYRKDSDIDILFQQKNVKESTLIHFVHKGIKVSLFSFSKEMLYDNEKKYLFTYHNMPITYISDTKILYDGGGYIEDLKDFVENIVIRRRLLRQILISDLKYEIAYLLQLKVASVIEDKKRCYSIVNKIISIFFLSLYADKVIGKREGNNPFATIMADDKELYVRLKVCLPYRFDSFGYLKWIYENYILTFY